MSNVRTIFKVVVGSASGSGGGDVFFFNNVYFIGINKFLEVDCIIKLNAKKLERLIKSISKIKQSSLL